MHAWGFLHPLCVGGCGCMGFLLLCDLHRRPPDLRLAEHRAGGEGQVGLGDLIGRQRAGLARAGVGQAGLGVEHVGAGDQAQVELALLGAEHAGLFSNRDELAEQFATASVTARERTWRLPLLPEYDRLLDSETADMKNSVAGAAGAITAAQFLQRFVKEDMPWIHLDIAGVASVSSETSYAPKGATGWGVRALSRFVQDNFE